MPSRNNRLDTIEPTLKFNLLKLVLFNEAAQNKLSFWILQYIAHSTLKGPEQMWIIPLGTKIVARSSETHVHT